VIVCERNSHSLVLTNPEEKKREKKEDAIILLVCTQK